MLETFDRLPYESSSIIDGSSSNALTTVPSTLTSEEATSHTEVLKTEQLPNSSRTTSEDKLKTSKSIPQRVEDTANKFYDKKGATCKHTTDKPFYAYLLISIPLLILTLWSHSITHKTIQVSDAKCLQTCKIRIVESIPVNISFPGGPESLSTFDAWSRIIDRAENELVIAAYKSSLQGKHVLEEKDLHFAREGDILFSRLAQKGKNVRVSMVESYPPKDHGDNADGVLLQEMGLVDRRVLDVSRLMGAGKMHSKFLLADNRHFYLGSANLDWRSLNQKMELGLLVEDCACLGADLRSVYDVYWNMSKGQKNNAKARYNKDHSLRVMIEGEPSDVYISSSPLRLNNGERTWDLDAILDVIDSSTEVLDVHVMDYHPIFLYRKPRALWPIIDDALRRAITRGVRVRILSAGIHYPEVGIRFLKSLQDLSGITRNASVEVKIFKVPRSEATTSNVVNRDRRTHNKVVVSESAALIGTSNWSGDYFEGGTTGSSIVVKQNGKRKTMINELVQIFERNWHSEYAHPVDDYLHGCVETDTADFCEERKDPKRIIKTN